MMPDIYVWKARRCPALLVALPLALAILALFPGADWKLLLPVCTFCGLFFLAAQIGRDRGYALQVGLFKSWGGSPTAILLRHHHTKFDKPTLGILHRWLARTTGILAPTEEQEFVSPKLADSAYDGYVRHLRDLTRDIKQYPLVFAENVNFGFRRNCLGLRSFGITMSCLGAVIGAASVFRFDDAGSIAIAVAVTVVNLLLLAFWWLWVNEGWVRIPADAYAERLLEIAMRMARESSPNATPARMETSP